MADIGKSKQPKNTSLKALYKDKVLFSKLVNLIDTDKSYDYIEAFLADSGKQLSRGSIYNLKKKVKESRDTGVSLDILFEDKRKKERLNQIDPAKVSGYTGKAAHDESQLDSSYLDLDTVDGGITGEVTDNKKQFYSTGQVLEDVIQKGMNALSVTAYVDIPVLLKAIEMYDKSHSKERHGLSINAIQQYQLITEAKLKAFNTIIMEYVPEEQQEEVYDKMKAEEDRVVQNLEITESGRSLIKALKEQGFDL